MPLGRARTTDRASSLLLSVWPSFRTNARGTMHAWLRAKLPNIFCNVSFFARRVFRVCMILRRQVLRQFVYELLIDYAESLDMMPASQLRNGWRSNAK